MPSLMMMTSMFPRNCLRGTHTDTHTQTFASSILNFFKVISDFENKKRCVCVRCRHIVIAVMSHAKYKQLFVFLFYMFNIPSVYLDIYMFIVLVNLM